jgi:cyclophilin family peptidyl-prolyl cis-trans isomerase/protein-disulfide isomerase
MLKKWLYTLPLLAVILLSACAGQTPAVSSTRAPAGTAVASAAPAGTPAAANPTVDAANATPDATTQATPAQSPTLAISTGPATCKVVDSLLPPIPDQYKPSIPAVDEKKDWISGSKDAPITLIEYSDFQCPYCEQIASQVSAFVAKYSKDVRLVYRHFPLTIHNKALLAAQAAEAAGLQGKFWEMHDFLFAADNWKVWTPDTMKVEDFQKYLTDKAAPAITGLDKAKFATDLTSTAIVAKAKDAQTAATTLANDQNNELQGTPTFYMLTNGSMYAVPATVTVFENVVNLIKLNAQRFKECPASTINTSKQYTATIKTEKGDIVVKLYADKAPTTVNSFIFLAKKGFYDGVTFHRVIADFVAQTGDPSNSGMGGPGYQYGVEIADGLAFDKEGILGMARSSDPSTNGSQFFITLAPVQALTRRYTVFGEVTSGMDVVKKLTPRDISTDANPVPGDKIISVTIQEN